MWLIYKDYLPTVIYKLQKYNERVMNKLFEKKSVLQFLWKITSIIHKTKQSNYSAALKYNFKNRKDLKKKERDVAITSTDFS